MTALRLAGLVLRSNFESPLHPVRFNVKRTAAAVVDNRIWNGIFIRGSCGLASHEWEGTQKNGWRFAGSARLADGTQPPDHASREVIDRQHEQNAEPEQPAVGRNELRQHGHAVHCASTEL